MDRFEHILEEGDVSVDIILYVESIMKNMEDVIVKTSNGFSHVFITPKDEKVYQYFRNKFVCDRITNIYGNMKNDMEIKINNNVLHYKVYDFIPQLITTHNNVIVWKKHTCLNSFSKEKLKDIIINNFTKFLWDINKALYGLHKNYILHGDARIDNIAIIDNNFILFDFDGSSIVEDVDVLEKDVYDFVKSIKFNLEDNRFKEIKNLIPESYNPLQIINKIILKRMNETNQNVNEVFNDLNNMKIIL
jgi:tRNA A-37 threonylcarbamoyl transferase component Bud32